MTDLTEKRLHTLLETYFTYDPKITFRFDADAKKTVTPLPFFVRYKAYLTAAAMVLAAVMSVSLFFSFRNKNAIPVAPSPPAAVAIDTANATETAVSTESKSEPTAQSETIDSPAAETQSTTAATERSTDAQGNIIITVITDITTTEQDPPKSEPAEPPEKESPTDAFDASDPPAPTEKPTEPTTSPPSVEPVYLYDYLNYYQTYTQPAIEEIQKDSFTVKVNFPSEALSEDDCLYCRIYDRRKNLWGSPDLYDEEHIANFTVKGNIIRASYTSDISETELSKDSHFFEFYDKYGRVFCIFELIPR